MTFLAIALLAISASAITANIAHAEDPTGDTSDSEAADLCSFRSQLDYPHYSGGDVSAHGWWRDENNDCPRYADVENWLEQWTCDASGGNCDWVKVAHDKTRDRQGGGRGRRNTVRHQCATSASIGYRNIVDVDVIGILDTPEKFYVTQNVDCRAIANGRPYTE